MGLIRPQELTSLSGPVSHHAPLRVVPERTVWVEVVLSLKSNRKITDNDEYTRFRLATVQRNTFLHWPRLPSPPMPFPTYVKVFEGEDNRLRDEDAAGLLVDGGRQDVGVDGECVVPHSSSFTHQPESGVLRGQEVPQVFVQHKDQLCNTCIPGRACYIHSFIHGINGNYPKTVILYQSKDDTSHFLFIFL